MEAGPGGISGTGCAARAARLSPHTRPALPAECLRGDGASYRGSRSVASGGAPCLNWGLAVRSGPGAELPAGGCEGSAFCCVFFFFLCGGRDRGAEVPVLTAPCLPQPPRITTAAGTPTAPPRPGATSEVPMGSPRGDPATSPRAQVRAPPPFLSPHCCPPLGFVFPVPLLGLGFVTRVGGVPPLRTDSPSSSSLHCPSPGTECTRGSPLALVCTSASQLHLAPPLELLCWHQKMPVQSFAPAPILLVAMGLLGRVAKG